MTTRPRRAVSRLLACVVLALVAGVLLSTAPTVASQDRRLALRTLLGEYRLLFEASPLGEDELRELARLSPHLAGWESNVVVPRLELCRPEDPAYAPCARRGPEEPGFFVNARVNLDRGARLIDRFRRLPHPKELEPVVQYLVRSLHLSLWLEETKLDFYRTWDARVLGRAYEGLDPAVVCRAVLDDVEVAASREDQYRLVDLTWHNCVNDAARQRLGGYPMDAWNEFLRSYAIEEQHIENRERAP